jgi:chromate transporter
MNTVLDIFLLFVRLGMLAFGGGSAVMSDMQREAVSRGWMTPTDFAHAYAINQLIPGPQMLFVAVVGYYGAGLAGALAAALGFLVPPPVLMLGLTEAWGRWARGEWASAIRRALGPVGIGLTASGVYVLAPASLSPPGTWLIFTAALVWLFVQPTRSPLWVVFGGVIAGCGLYLLLPR